VTFTPTDAPNYTTASATVRITVSQLTPTITWNTPAAITYGAALGATQLNASASVPGTFAYSPAAGTVLDAGSRTLSVAFTPTDAATYATATKTVSIVVNKATPTVTWTAPADITYGTALSATQLNATASVPGTFAYTPAAGSVLPVGSAQVLSVTFTPTDATNYTNVTRTASITVTKATPVVTWPKPNAIIFGTPLSATQLNATANAPGVFVYTPAAGTVLGAGTKTLSVTFTPTDTANYTTATATTTITVLQAMPDINWPPPGDVTYGTPLGDAQLNAWTNDPGGSTTSATEMSTQSGPAGSYTYDPPPGTILDAGVHTLTVAFTPADPANYASVTKAVPLTVHKATPAVAWAAPADIVYGTTLGASQLNAATNVPGRFEYSPADGKRLNAGTAQMLSVTFTPTDLVNYVTITKAVSISVLKATPVITWNSATANTVITDTTALGPAQLNASADIPGTF